MFDFWRELMTEKWLKRLRAGSSYSREEVFSRLANYVEKDDLIRTLEYYACQTDSSTLMLKSDDAVAALNTLEQKPERRSINLFIEISSRSLGTQAQRMRAADAVRALGCSRSDAATVNHLLALLKRETSAGKIDWLSYDIAKVLVKVAPEQSAVARQQYLLPHLTALLSKDHAHSGLAEEVELTGGSGDPTVSKLLANYLGRVTDQALSDLETGMSTSYDSETGISTGSWFDVLNRIRWTCEAIRVAGIESVAEHLARILVRIPAKLRLETNQFVLTSRSLKPDNEMRKPIEDLLARRR